MKRNRKGSAMIVVLCVMAIVMVLSLALLLSASIVVANANRRKQQEQCKISASSFSKVLEEDLKDTASVEKSGTFRAYARKQMKDYMDGGTTGWTYYNEDEGDAHSLTAAKRTFQMNAENLKDKVGDLTVEAYWESEKRYSYVSLVFTVEAREGKESYKRQIKYQLQEMTPEEYMASYPDKPKPSEEVWLWKREGIQ